MATCHMCGTPATDPTKGASPWQRAVIGDEQVLICPDCQRRDPNWVDRATSCPSCGSKRVHKALGDKVCRSCGHQWSTDTFTL